MRSPFPLQGMTTIRPLMKECMLFGRHLYLQWHTVDWMLKVYDILLIFMFNCANLHEVTQWRHWQGNRVTIHRLRVRVLAGTIA